MSRPSFQFYTKDWRSNSKLRRCSPAARGVWVDILCALHDSDEYGIARYPLKELASEVGASMAHVRELVDKGVLKGADAGTVEALIYVPRSGRKEGPAVTLLDEQQGPVWYSSRMVKDEYVRTVRGEQSRFGADDSEAPKARPKRAPNPPLGDGSSTASATAITSPPSGEKGLGTPLPPAPAPEPPAPEPPPPPPAPPPDPLPGFTPTAAGLATRAIRATGIADVNPGHPGLQRLLDGGVTTEALAATATELVGKGKASFALLLATHEGRLRDAAAAGNVPRPVAVQTTVPSGEASRTRAALVEDRDREARLNSPEEKARVAAVIAAARQRMSAA